MKKLFCFVSWSWKFVQSFPLLTLVTVLFGFITCSDDVPKSAPLVITLIAMGGVLLFWGFQLNRPPGDFGSGIGNAITQMVGLGIGWLGVVLLINALVLIGRIFV